LNLCEAAFQGVCLLDRDPSAFCALLVRGKLVTIAIARLSRRRL